MTSARRVLRSCALLACALVAGNADSALAQIPIVAGEVTIVDFDGIGTSAQAELPDGARVATYPEARASGSFSAAETATLHRGGNGMTVLAPGGVYNFGSGDPVMARDRAIGFVLDNDGIKSGALYLHLVNRTGKPLSRLTFGEMQELYRAGTGPEGGGVSEVVGLFSVDGESFNPWDFTTTGLGMSTSIHGFDDAPLTSSGSFGTASGLPVTVPPDGTFYIGFRYSVSEGGDVGEMPAIAIDDIVIGPDDADFNFMTPYRLQREFRGVRVGETSPIKQLDLGWFTNAYGLDGPDTPPTITVTGQHAEDFEVEQLYSAPSVFMDFLRYEISFTPSASGVRTATLTLSGPSVVSDPIELTGVGTVGTASGAQPSERPTAFVMSQPYPNPARSSIRVHLGSGQSRDVRLDLVNTLGQVVGTRSTSILAGGTERAIDFDVSGLPVGVYVLRAIDKEETVHRAVTVLR